MVRNLAQDGRMGKLTTALGPDTLVLHRFTGEEHVNALFSYEIEAVSELSEIDFDALVGTAALVTLKTFENPDQPFHGIITAARFAGVVENGWRYHLTIRPWFWLASLRRNQRIFHNMTVVAILDELLAAYSHLGQPAVEKKLTGNYETLEYTVQYRESDMSFATRLMERFGISYHFAHSDTGHTLVMTDEMTEHDPLVGGSRKFIRTDDSHRANEEHFWQVEPTRRITTGAIRLTDYNFKKPLAMMEADFTGNASYEEGDLESYDFPGVYLDQAEGQSLAKLRTLQERGQDHRHFATGDCTSMRAGLTVKITGDSIAGVDDPCLCLSAFHSYSSDAYTSGGGGNEPTYEGSYVLMPTSVALAPERKTFVPAVQGPQTAQVVGDGEIDCDEYGRILVLFHWDLAKANSMRCRVSQNWAGKGWGGMVIPRIGMEVVVEFLEGNPDMPLVTGCVYNGKNDVPYPLPANKTRSTFKTDTHQGTGFNELRFEDAKAKEEIYIHAQKDRNEKTLHNHSERIDNNWVQSVGHNKSIEVDNNHIEAIGGNMSLTVGPSGVGQVVSGALTGLAGGLGQVAEQLGLPGILNPGEGHLIESIEKTKTQTIGLMSTTTIGVAQNVTVGKSIQVTSGKTMGVSVGERSTESVGKIKNIDVGDELVITVGKSRLIMKKDGTIQLIGKDIQFKASDDVTVEAGKDIDVKSGKKTDLASGSKTTIKGSKVHIN